MPETNLEQAVRAMEKIRKEISYFAFTQDISLTVSIGIAGYCGQDTNRFIEDADKMMYEAKKLGKNRISF